MKVKYILSWTLFLLFYSTLCTRNKKQNFISAIACRDAKEYQKQKKKVAQLKEKTKEQLDYTALGNYEAVQSVPVLLTQFLYF